MELLKKLGAVKIISMIAAGFAVLALLAFLVMQMSSAVLSPLYSDLDTEDVNLIASRLTAMNIKYEMAANSEIKVPGDKVLMLRMMFAQEGIPKVGNIVGYEIFDKDNAFGTSQFVYNVNLVRALEGELARTIASINQIENVRVHVVMPKKELFSKVGADPSASVVLKMRGNQSLSKAEVSAVSNIVATAVPGLKVENITIVDNSGRPLKLGAEDQSAASLTSTAVEFQQNIETRLRREIEELVERFVGVGKVKANVAAEIDFDREIIDSEEYDPDKQVVRSKKTTEEKVVEGQPGSNAVGVGTNLPNNSGSGGGGGTTSKDSTRTDEMINYEISKTVTSKVVENGRVKKLSIAIIVDGIYDLDATTGAAIYKPRDPVELDKLKSLIISGMGLNLERGDKIEVTNLQFSPDFASIPTKEGMFDFLKSDLQGVIQTVVIGIVLTLVVLLIVRPVVLRALETATDYAAPQLDTGGLIASLEQEVNIAATSPHTSEVVEAQGAYTIPSTVEDQKRNNVIKNLNDVVEKHPDETASIVRNWLYKE